MNERAVNFEAAEVVNPRFEIRPLSGSDANAYRALRQRILDIGDGRFFSDSYEREARLTTSELWRDWCTEKREHCIIGTFADKALVGAMMITRQGGADSPVVEWEATWLDPLYRGHKVGKAGYERVTQWSLNQGFSFAAVFIRSDNQRSQDIRAQQGFAYAYTIAGETWADGSVGDTNAYVMGLRGETAAERRQIAIDHLEDILGFLNQGPHGPRQDMDKATPVGDEVFDDFDALVKLVQESASEAVEKVAADNAARGLPIYGADEGRLIVRKTPLKTSTP